MMTKRSIAGLCALVVCATTTDADPVEECRRASEAPHLEITSEMSHPQDPSPIHEVAAWDAAEKSCAAFILRTARFLFRGLPPQRVD